MQTGRLTATTILLASLFADSVSAADSAGISFSRDIRPILSSRCYFCHGPDDDTREADLRLDQFGAATQLSGGNGAIVPGHAARSEVVRRILSDDPDEMMPPLSSNKSLTSEEKQLLIRWINSGAEYEQHWSFILPRRPALPDVSDPAWPRNEIDRFILARQDEAGLKPSPEAAPQTLVRRVFLDLIGLPPTPDEADVWSAKIIRDREAGKDDTYVALVNSLLESPRYGERWARRWLDLARYADTNGYEKDRDRTMWPYRDWVINALNADMPFDQFTIEQIAGDMLPNATIEQRIATGFHRNTMLNEEGGIDPLEFRFYAMTDRVATTGTTWLGLTTGCCQCHTHKYDPVTQRDYYGMMAFLNNADEPDLNLPDPASEQRYHRNLEAAETLLADLQEHWPGSSPEEKSAACQSAFEKWLEVQLIQTPSWTVLRPSEMSSNLPHLSLEQDGSIFASGDTTKFDTYELQFDRWPVDTLVLRLEALPDDRLPARGPGSTYYEGRKGDFFLNEFALSVDGKPVPFQSASHSYAKNQFGKNPVSAQLTIDGDYQTGWSAASRPGERSVAVYNLKETLPAGKSVSLKMTFGRHFASSLGRFRLSAGEANGPAVANELPAELDALLKTPENELTEAQRQSLFEAFLLQAPEIADHTRKIRELRKRPAALAVPVLQERPSDNPRPTFVHNRGEYLQPKGAVGPRVPESLHGFSEDVPRNRLGFARWLVARDNPLTSRVVTNRHWAAFFGTGIVRTLDDLGMQGESPSHPELLDWLAVEFIETGWSLKKLHRKIVLSATYRQSSTVNKQQLPDGISLSDASRLLARFPRTRLEAEVIRDAILHASGLLSSKMGGPPVRPPQPAGVTEVAFGRPKWKTSTGEDRYRRSVYTYQKRTAPFAMFNTFDAPSGEACVARRDVSNTALQALTLLNDAMFLEPAQALGRMIAKHEGSDEDRIAFAFRRALTRKPDADELSRIFQFVEKQRQRFNSNELKPEAVIGNSAKSDASAEVAVWTALARSLFSLDESLTKN